MTVAQAVSDTCKKHGLCSSGCPLYEENIVVNNMVLQSTYLCNHLDSQELMDKLLLLGYDIDGTPISIEETDYWRMYES